MKIKYIGSFPPPYGGVTIKNKMLYEILSKRIKIEKIDLSIVKKKGICSFPLLIIGILNPVNIFVIGTSGKYRKLLTRTLFYFNKKSLNRSLLIVMGGVASKEIALDTEYLKWIAEYKQVYVETEGMKKDLTDQGLKNISIFPNCREKPEKIIIKENKEKKLKLLFFSQISKEKGADIILEAGRKLEEDNIPFEIDFYGHIKSDYNEEFISKINLLSDVHYKGVFQPETENLYLKLQEYDVLLFPSKWKTEGVPGILVEAKMVALPAIVSDVSYNREIIEHKIDGVVLEENTPIELANSILQIHLNRELLTKLKLNAQLSSEKYLLENYLENIVMNLSE